MPFFTKSHPTFILLTPTLVFRTTLAHLGPLLQDIALGSTLDAFGYLSKAKSKSKSDPDTLCYHEAMRAPDADQFKEAMQIEIDALDH